MATLNKDEARRHRASKHARHVHECPICDKQCRGNGGWASHRIKHVKAAGYTDGDIFGWGLRVLFNAIAYPERRPPGLLPPAETKPDESMSNVKRRQKIKVYGWTGFRSCAMNGQTREIVATTSKKEAARLASPDREWLRPNVREMCETGNAEEIAQAMSSPHTVFWHPLDELPRARTWRTI